MGDVDTVEATTIEALVAQVVPEPAYDSATMPQDRFEQTLWQVDAFACLVRQEAKDCDLHVEVASTCATGPRVVVEVPASFGREAQETLLDAVGIPRLGRRPWRFIDPPPVTVVGWGFYDYEHRCATDVHGCGHGSTLVGTLAELHGARVERRQP